MRVPFSDLDGVEEQTLYIIGNGFDLFHGINSSYKHFYSWLNLNDGERFAAELQILFPKLNKNLDCLWSNFEEAMRHYNVEKLHKHYYNLPNKPWDKAECIKAVQRISQICGQIKPRLKDWAKQIIIDNINPQLELSKKSKYLTFNYTMLLEKVYSIPLEQICHIHGSIDSLDDLVVGHNYSLPTDNIEANSDEEETFNKCVITEMNKFDKKVTRRIETNTDFFSSLETVSRVVVLGHSLGEIDMPYFGKILNIISPDAHWHFSKHKCEDEDKISCFLSKSNIDTKKIDTRNRWIFNF